MVHIVLVSHSKRLAESTCELVLQAAPHATIVGVGGVGENFEDFGTDATAIMEAIESVYSEDGVLLLMDMGSALLSTEMALSLLEERVASKVCLCAAPIVEGAMVAAVHASMGEDIVQVKREAMESLGAKLEQLSDSTAHAPPPPPSVQQATETKDGTPIPSDAIVKEYVIHNEHGLHVRPAAFFVQKIKSFDAHVYITATHSAHTHPITAKSLNSIAKLNVRQGDTVTLYAWGTDAQNCIDAIQNLISSNFGEQK